MPLIKISTLKTHFALTYLLVLFLALTLRTTQDQRWGEWFGSPQTLLSMEYWQQDGWLAHKLLFIPQGYYSQHADLNDPKLSHHLHGGSVYSVQAQKNIPTSHYTHYPAGYLIPFTALRALELTDHRWFHLLANLISCLALYFYYLTFRFWCNHRIALIFIIFYSTNAIFLAFSDSLANHPLDDLLRALLLFSWTKFYCATIKGQNIFRYYFLTCLLQLFLSLSSFDSILFIAVWFIGGQIFFFKKINWRQFVLALFITIFGFLINGLQNSWYLGFNLAAQDLIQAFFMRGGGFNLFSRLDTLLLQVNRIFPSGGLGILIILISYLILRFFHGKQTSKLNIILKPTKFQIYILLLLGGIAFPFLLPNGGIMIYQGRQLLPFFALFIADWTSSYWSRPSPNIISGISNVYLRRLMMSFSFFLLSLIWGQNFYYGWQHSNHLITQTNYAQRIFVSYDISKSQIELAQHLNIKNASNLIENNSEQIVFTLKGFEKYFNQNQEFGQIDPVLEHYSQAMILAFVKADTLIHDLNLLWEKNPSLMITLVSSDKNVMNDLVEKVNSLSLIHKRSQHDVKQETFQHYFIYRFKWQPMQNQ